MWIPVQSKPLIYFWQLWPMLIEESDSRDKVVVLIVASSVAFLAAAIFLGWILQFVWGLLLSVFKRT